MRYGLVTKYYYDLWYYVHQVKFNYSAKCDFCNRKICFGMIIIRRERGKYMCINCFTKYYSEREDYERLVALMLVLRNKHKMFDS